MVILSQIFHKGVFYRLNAELSRELLVLPERSEGRTFAITGSKKWRDEGAALFTVRVNAFVMHLLLLEFLTY